MESEGRDRVCVSSGPRHAPARNSGVGEEFKHKQIGPSRFALMLIVYIMAEYIMQRSIPNSYWLYTSGMRAGCVTTEALMARSRQQNNTACCEAGVP